MAAISLAQRESEPILCDVLVEENTSVAVCAVENQWPPSLRPHSWPSNCVGGAWETRRADHAFGVSGALPFSEFAIVDWRRGLAWLLAWLLHFGTECTPSGRLGTFRVLQLES